MNMVVVVTGCGAGRITKRVFQTPFIIKDLMNQTPVEKCLDCSVNSHTIERIVNLLFNVGMGKGIAFFKEKVENFLPVWR
jgi:hypothetical protein